MVGKSKSATRRTFWYETLSEADTRVGRFKSTGQQGYVESVEQLPETDCVALQHLAQQFGVTLNTLLQAAWALVVAEFTQNDEIMFGITVSGRANDLENIETIAGLFINTLPLHLKLERNTRLSDWLKAIQTKQFTLQQFEYSSLADIKNGREPRSRLTAFLFLKITRLMKSCSTLISLCEFIR